MPTGDQVHRNSNEVPIELRAASEVQQDLALACTLKSEIVWDVLGPDQSDLLLRKLEYMYPGDTKLYTSKQDIRRARRHNANVNEIRGKLFRNIWQQNSNSSSDCCMIFIDEQSRIYQNWNDFVNNNELPIGTMVAPANGCYTLNNNNVVQLECALTPAYHRKSLAKMDTLISAASMVGQATTFLHPAFSLVTIGAKTYETIRDYHKMSDKVQHGTATRTSANLNLSGNVICLTSSVVTLGAYMAVPQGGALSFTAGMSIQAINSAATVINCTKFILTTYDIFTRYFMDEDELNFSDLVAFGSSLLLLTHSINNMAIISQLGNVGGNTLRSLLQTKIKAGLSLVAEEAVRFADQYGGNYDIIRLVNDIPYRDVLRNTHTIYKSLTCTGFLTTISALGVVAMEVAPGLAVQVTDKEITQLDFVELTKHFGSKFVRHIANSDNLIDVLNAMGIYFSEAVVQLLCQQTRQFIDTAVEAIDKEQSTLLTTEMILFKMFSFAAKNYKDLSFEFLDKKRDDLIQGVTKYFQSFNPKPSSDLDDSAKHSCDVCGGYFYLTNL